MHNTRKISRDYYWVGASDRRLELFENVMPITKGVSYNSYLLMDEKTKKNAPDLDAFLIFYFLLSSLILLLLTGKVSFNASNCLKYTGLISFVDTTSFLLSSSSTLSSLQSQYPSL